MIALRAWITAQAASRHFHSVPLMGVCFRESRRSGMGQEQKFKPRHPRGGR